MTQTFGQGWQDVNEAALPVVGTPARTSDEVITGKVDKNLDQPMRMYGAIVPDNKLYFSASRVEVGNGSARVKPAIDDKMPIVVASSLTMTTANTSTGATFQVNGATLAIPAGTAGQFRRLVAALRATGEINLRFSDEAASVGALELPETLLSGLDGDPIGWTDLEYATTTAFKTPGSATTVIENKVGSTSCIFNISGGGSGGGADRTWRITSFSSTGWTHKGGYGAIDDKRVLSSGSGTTKLTAAADQTIVGANVLSASGLAALGTINSASAVKLSLVIDLYSLADPIALDNLRQVYRWTESNLRFLTAEPKDIDPRRYLFLNEVYIPITVSAWTTVEAIPVPSRIHDSLVAFSSVPQAVTLTHTGVTATQSHNLTGKPQVIDVRYWDGTNERPVESESHVVFVTATEIRIDPAGLDTTAGKEFRIYLVHFPAVTDVATPTSSFTGGPYTSAGPTTLAHLLPQPGHNVVFWAVEEVISTGAMRVVGPGLVTGWNATHVTLDWAGIPFTDAGSNALRYWIKGGPSPSAALFPLEFGGFTKLVGRGPGSYALLSTALAAAVAGDRINVMRDISETAALVIPAGVEVYQMPNTLVTLTATAFASGAIRLTGAKAKWRQMNTKVTGITGTLAKAVSVEAADCKVEGDLEIDTTGQIVTDAVEVAVAGVRAKVDVAVKLTAGTLTNLIDNQDGAGNANVYGGNA